jgi:1,2-phenylacetyl-CoA epoxidase PaaB subunit
LEEESEP